MTAMWSERLFGPLSFPSFFVTVHTISCCTYRRNAEYCMEDWLDHLSLGSMENSSLLMTFGVNVQKYLYSC